MTVSHDQNRLAVLEQYLRTLRNIRMTERAALTRVGKSQLEAACSFCARSEPEATGLLHGDRAAICTHCLSVATEHLRP
jgi:hypothetical protein